MSIRDNANAVLQYLQQHVDSDRHLSDIAAVVTAGSEPAIRNALDYLRDNDLLNQNPNNLSLVGARAGVKLTTEVEPSRAYHRARVRTAMTQLRRDLETNVRPLSRRRPDIVPPTHAQRIEIDLQRLEQDLALIRDAF